jgi:hypothetical protein
VTTDTGAGVERALSTCYTETDARFEFSDELSRETYGYIYYLRHGDGYDVVGFGDGCSGGQTLASAWMRAVTPVHGWAAPGR